MLLTCRVGRSCEPGVEAVARGRPVHFFGHGALERREQSFGLRATEHSRLSELFIDPAAANLFLEQPLAERTGTLVGRLLCRDELRDDLGQ